MLEAESFAETEALRLWRESMKRQSEDLEEEMMRPDPNPNPNWRI